MRKFTVTVVVGLALAGCSSENDPPLAPEIPTITTSTTPPTSTLAPTTTRSSTTRPSSSATASSPAVESYQTFYGWAVPTEAEKLSLGVFATPQPTLVEVDAQPHDNFDRIVFRFAHGFPECTFWYGQHPRSPSGEFVRLPDANAFLHIMFEGATAHDQFGNSTIAQGSPKGRVNLNTLKSYDVIDFEAVWAYLGFGVTPQSDAVRQIRVAALHSGDRYTLVFDVRH